MIIYKNRSPCPEKERRDREFNEYIEYRQKMMETIFDARYETGEIVTSEEEIRKKVTKLKKKYSNCKANTRI